MNLYFWKVQQKSVEIVQTSWILHLIPPVVQVETREGRYRVTGTGISYRMAKPLPEQLTGCPFPGLVLELAVRGFLFRHRAKMPWVFVGVTAISVAIYAASAWLLIEHPAAGEMLQNTLWNALLLSIAVCVPLAALRMFKGFRDSANHVWQSELARIDEVQELPTGEPATLDIGTDIFVFQYKDESPTDFLKRVEAVQINLPSGVWAVTMRFRDPLFHILTGKTKAETWNRNLPPFHPETTPEENRIVPTYAVFDSEDYEDFEWYLNEFALQYRRWAPAYKAEKSGADAFTTWKDGIKSITITLLFLLCSFASFAQSAAAVQKATAGIKPPAQGADISYMFAKKTMGRIGNGRLNYTDLLKSIPTYQRLLPRRFDRDLQRRKQWWRKARRPKR
jgi:hypothetical protein